MNTRLRFSEEGQFIMEINTEINRVFGTEMAKLFAETISN